MEATQTAREGTAARRWQSTRVSAQSYGDSTSENAPRATTVRAERCRWQQTNDEGGGARERVRPRRRQRRQQRAGAPAASTARRAETRRDDGRRVEARPAATNADSEGRGGGDEEIILGASNLAHDVSRVSPDGRLCQLCQHAQSSLRGMFGRVLAGLCSVGIGVFGQSFEAPGGGSGRGSSLTHKW